MDVVIYVLLAVGMLLFLAGDLWWFARYSLNRPMEMKRTGVLVGSGVLLISIALLLILVR